MEKVVILLYHQIIKDGLDSEKMIRQSSRLYVRAESRFRGDVEYLKKRKYQVISLYDLIKTRRKGSRLFGNGVVITFDDGDKSNYNIVFPILKEYGLKATFFIITNKVGEEGYMNWDEIGEIADYRNSQGEKLFNVESHSHFHSALSQKRQGEDDGQYKKRISRELKISQEIIEKRTGIKPQFLALPGGSGGGKGRNDKLIRKLAKECGYLGIRTSNNGVVSPSSDIYKLPVFPVLNKTNIKGIEIWLKYSFLVFSWRIFNKAKGFLKLREED